MFVELTIKNKGLKTSLLAKEIIEVREIEANKTLIIQRHVAQGFYVVEGRNEVVSMIKEALNPSLKEIPFDSGGIDNGYY